MDTTHPYGCTYNLRKHRDDPRGPLYCGKPSIVGVYVMIFGGNPGFLCLCSEHYGSRRIMKHPYFQPFNT